MAELASSVPAAVGAGLSGEELRVNVEIAFAGPMGAGKTTLADALVAARGYRRLSFADPIRFLCQLVLGRPIEKQRDRGTMQRLGGAGRSPDWAGIDTPYEPARLARATALATHLLPEAGPEAVAKLYDALYRQGYAYGFGQERYWIDRWRHELLHGRRPVVVDDVRFPVEGEVLASEGFFVVQLRVPLEERKRRIVQRDGAWNDAWTNDATEAYAERIPTHLELDGTQSVEALTQRVLEAAEAWALKR